MAENREPIKSAAIIITDDCKINATPEMEISTRAEATLRCSYDFTKKLLFKFILLQYDSGTRYHYTLPAAAGFIPAGMQRSS